MGQEASQVYAAGGATEEQAKSNLELLLRAHDDRMRVDWRYYSPKQGLLRDKKLVVYRQGDRSFPPTLVDAKRNPDNGLLLFSVVL